MKTKILLKRSHSFIAKLITPALMLLTFQVVFNSCQKEDNENLNIVNEVSFAINVLNEPITTNLKNTEEYILDDAKTILLTIQNIDGSPTKYNSSELKVLQMNGVYFTQKIVLKTGEYRLTQFIVFDSNDSVIFISPLSTSREAQNVENALPLSFSVVKNITTPIEVEVLSTEKKKPEDFGLTHFPIIEVSTFNLMIGVTDSKLNKILNANITITSGSYTYVQELDSIVNNIVTLKDGYNEYLLEIEKDGYVPYNQLFSIDSLLLHSDETGNVPLIIELENNSNLIPIDGLIVYYQFNGNANDLSGNSLDGALNNVTPDYNRFNESEGAYLFHGSTNSFIASPTSTILSFSGEISMCAWVKQTGNYNDILRLIGQGDDGHEIGTNTNGFAIANFSYPTGGISLTSTTTINDGQWHLVVATFSDKRAKLFVDGSLETEMFKDEGIQMTTPGSLVVGKNPVAGTPFNGIIDDVRIFNRALSVVEVSALYFEKNNYYP